jgi:SAM-dependent methyltransferase
MFSIPSQFCTLTATEVEKETPIVEFGCGNGRDSIFFARHGYNITAMDLSSEVIKYNTEKTVNISNINFLQGNVANYDDVKNTINIANKNNEKNLVVYSRFFLHSLDQEQEQKFMISLSQLLKPKDRIYFEFRSKEDENKDKIYGKHYRRFIDSDSFIRNLEDNYNFIVEYSITGQGMAKYKSEDPFITRIIAKKR